MEWMIADKGSGMYFIIEITWQRNLEVWAVQQAWAAVDLFDHVMWVSRQLRALFGDINRKLSVVTRIEEDHCIN